MIVEDMKMYEGGRKMYGQGQSIRGHAHWGHLGRSKQMKEQTVGEDEGEPGYACHGSLGRDFQEDNLLMPPFIRKVERRKVTSMPL